MPNIWKDKWKHITGYGWPHEQAFLDHIGTWSMNPKPRAIALRGYLRGLEYRDVPWKGLARRYAKKLLAKEGKG